MRGEGHQVSVPPLVGREQTVSRDPGADEHVPPYA